MGGETSLFTHCLCRVSRGPSGSLQVTDTGPAHQGKEVALRTDSCPGNLGGGVLTALVSQAGKGCSG